MNKKFYFALALTAGLFASCSSDDLAEAPGLTADESNDAAAIKIEVAKPNAATRGTGAVGVKDNKWEGQDFQLFMFEKGTLNLATYEDETHAIVPIFDNYNMTTRKDGTGSADYWIADPADPTNTVIQYNYFPTSGSYSFWGYRADDAAAAYKLVKDDGTDAADAAEAATVRVPVTINGTQDLMIAETKESDAATQLKGVVTTLSDDEAAAKIYSAYAARRGVNPKLQFSHLLSRIYFEVEAGDRDVSDAATIKTTDPNEYAGFRITSVKVKSKSKGYIVAAYKDAIPADAQRLVWDDGDGDPTNDETWPAATADDAKTRWNNEATLATFELKSREKVVDEPAQVAFKQRTLGAANITIDATYDFDGDGNPETVANSGVIAFNDETSVYTSDALDATTGLPTAAPTTIKALKDAGNDPTTTFVYYLFVRDGVHDGTTIAWNKPTYTEDPSQRLKPTLDEVTPEWAGYAPATAGTPEWQALVETAVTYTWTERAAHVVDPAADTDLGADKEPSTDPAVAGAYNVGDFVYSDFYGSVRKWELTAIKYNTEGWVAGDHTVDPSLDDVDAGKIIKDGTDYYVAGTQAGTGSAEVLGNAVATPIGESLLVAPNDETGHYLIEIGFKRTKKVTSTKVQELNGTAYLAPAVTSGKFEAGKSYKITLVLYSDGEIKSEGYTIINWTDGTPDLTEPKYEL